MFEDGRGTLKANGDEVSIPIPQDGQIYDLVVHADDIVAWVGTFQLQGDGSAKTSTTRALGGGAAGADQTIKGNFAAVLGANEEVASVQCTAYTSGELNVRLLLIPKP